MLKIIWTCWLPGRENAPPEVEACLAGWERLNPAWELRCLDAASMERFAPVREHIDLDRQSVGAGALSGILRVLLLHEFGGVWVDATRPPRRPLDEWLPDVMAAGFFAFAGTAAERPLETWFLCAEYDSRLMSSWWRATVEYWSQPTRACDRFWLENRFGDICRADRRAAAAWARACAAGVQERRGALVGPAAERYEGAFAATDPKPGVAAPRTFAALSVSTENVGDHIQILAGLRMLSRLGIEPARYIDRDHAIASAPGLAHEDGPVGILLNGWFKSNRSEWPPHPKLLPLMLGFHIRLFQCPELLSDASIEYFRRHEPIGCRDVYTERLLRSRGVDAFTSNCLSLTLPRRTENPQAQSDVFVVSRDERIEARLGEAIGPYTFVSHYSGSCDFDANMLRAAELLDTYRTRAKLLVTTLLHCALPAIAMGIPVVVFYPLNDETLHASDRERFSSLESLVRVYRFEELESVDWNPAPVDVGAIKLGILDRFYELAARWASPSDTAVGTIAEA